MLITLSPAKTLDFETIPTVSKSTKPMMLNEAETLVRIMRVKKLGEIKDLMKISEKIASLNMERFKNWSKEISKSESKQAIYAFMGDVYTGLDAKSFNAKDLKFAQTHLRILSGLYGILRPLDRLQPYRLEMGTKLRTDKGRTLYEFWGDQITSVLNKHAQLSRSTYLLNLASEEYFKVVNKKKLKIELITPIFKDRKNGEYKIISFFAKKARGMMAKFVIKNQITDPSDLAAFNEKGYFFDSINSKTDAPIFLREERPA